MDVSTATVPLRKSMSSRAVTVSLVIGTSGITVVGIQPLLLGTLLDQGRVNSVELGWTATAEILAMASALIFAPFWLRGVRTRWIVVAAAAVMLAANLLTAQLALAWQIVGCRGVAGFAEGILTAVAILTISYLPRPEKLGAIFLTASGPPPLLLNYLLPTYLNPTFGPNAGFFVMAAIAAACAVGALAFTEPLVPDHGEERHTMIWTPAVVLALLGTLIANSGFGACWAYLEPFATGIGLSPGQTGTALTISVFCQTLGSALVVVLAHRIRVLPFLIITSILQAVFVGFLIVAKNSIEFTVAIGFAGLLWQAGASCSIALVAALDRSRATAPLAFPLQLSGLSLGPFAAAFVVSGGVSRAFVLGAGALLIGVLLYLLVGAISRETRAVYS